MAVTLLAVFLMFDDVVLVVGLFGMVPTVGLALSTRGTCCWWLLAGWRR
jgi:hypothetical protein